MNFLVEDLLQLAQSEDETTAFKKERVNLSEVIEDVLIGLEAMAYEKAIGFECNIEKNLETMGDYGRIRQIAIILLDNGIKYGPKGEPIKLSLVASGKYINFTVTNSIKDNHKIDENKIFDRFYRGDSSREHSQGGYGLGLSIAKSFVETLGGSISFKVRENTIEFTVSFLKA